MASSSPAVEVVATTAPLQVPPQSVPMAVDPPPSASSAPVADAASSLPVIINDRGNVCMNCWEKAGYDVNMLMCPCFAAANPSPIPERFPKANQIPCLAYIFFPTGHQKGTSANALYKLFSDYGTVTKVEIPTAANYGLVTFENVDDAERALDTLNEQGHFVEWFDWFDAAFDYKATVIKTGSSPSNTSSSQG